MTDTSKLSENTPGQVKRTGAGTMNPAYIGLGLMGIVALTIIFSGEAGAFTLAAFWPVFLIAGAIALFLISAGGRVGQISRQVENAGFRPTHVITGQIGMKLQLDANSRRLFIGPHEYGFDDLERVTAVHNGSKSYVEIRLRSGQHALLKFFTRNENDASLATRDICTVLGWEWQ